MNGHEAEGSVNAKTKVQYAMHPISANYKLQLFRLCCSVLLISFHGESSSTVQ